MNNMIEDSRIQTEVTDRVESGEDVLERVLQSGVEGSIFRSDGDGGFEGTTGWFDPLRSFPIDRSEWNKDVQEVIEDHPDVDLGEYDKKEAVAVGWMDQVGYIDQETAEVDVSWEARYVIIEPGHDAGDVKDDLKPKLRGRADEESSDDD